MNARTQFLLTITLSILVFAITALAFSRRDQDPLQIFPAAVSQDCAPWDGPAFTVSIPVAESVIAISMYRSPDIRLPVSFSFPDETRRDGNALLLVPVGVPEQLTGKVYFQRVEQGKLVRGKFDLTSDTGEHFNGMFKAEWDNEIVYCG